MHAFQGYGNEIHCHVYTFAKFQENATVFSYIHVQYTIDTMNIQYQKKKHCSVGITGYEYLHGKVLTLGAGR